MLSAPWNALDGIGVAAALLILSGAAGWLLRSRPKLCQTIAQFGTILAALIGFFSSAYALAGRQQLDLHFAWNMPWGSLHAGLDGLSAFFLVPIFGLTGIAALYGRAYLAPHEGESKLGRTWFNLCTLAAGMVLVMIARDGLFFLVAWEIMALAPFFLVAFDDEKEGVRHAAWVYMIATHIGTAMLIVMFLLLGRGGSLDFDSFGSLAASPALASTIFVLAVIGFGSKAGFMPAHVWLPDAHPVAPSHVSAMMSGVMIKTGIYGLIRILTFLGTPDLWWAWTLLGIGVISGVLGVAFAMAQRDLKRLLAYSSVENIGIITLGLGLGVLGWSRGSEALTILGFAGALMHALNHSIFKGLLFLGAGSVLHEAKSLDPNRLGGLQKRMPWTAGTFLTGASAIVGLPPLNGFIGEFLLFLAALTGVVEDDPVIAAGAMLVLVSLGLISGLVAACFAGVYGVIFLGTPRNGSGETHEAPQSMRLSMVLLAVGCVAVGLLGFMIVNGLSGPVMEITGLSQATVSAELASAADSLRLAVLGFSAAILFTALLWMIRRRLVLRVSMAQGPTWGCGYLRPTPRMQYTASSFAMPITRQMATLLRTRQPDIKLAEPFADPAAFHSETADVFHEHWYTPIFRWTEKVAAPIRRLQHGNVHLYVLYIVITLVALLIWKVE